MRIIPVVFLVRAGRVLVHCARGRSRSATLVLAYLMIRERLTLVEAVEAVRTHRKHSPKRWIFESAPSPGLLLGSAEENNTTRSGRIKHRGRINSNVDFWLLTLHFLSFPLSMKTINNDFIIKSITSHDRASN